MCNYKQLTHLSWASKPSSSNHATPIRVLDARIATHASRRTHRDARIATSALSSNAAATRTSRCRLAITSPYPAQVGLPVANMIPGVLLDSYMYYLLAVPAFLSYSWYRYRGLEYIVVNYRWLFVCLFLLPLSAVYDVYYSLRHRLVFALSSAPHKHESRVRDVQRQVSSAPRVSRVTPLSNKGI